MLTCRCRLEPTRPAEAETCLSEALRAWHLRPGLAHAWLLSVAEHVRDPADLVMEYDEDLHLVSMEAWVDGRRAFGIDDLV